MKRGKCFIDKKVCRDDCVLYRRGVRINELNGKNDPFEECAFNIMADCMENMVGRMIGLQKEENKTANKVEDFTNVFLGALEQSAKRRLES